MWQNYFNSLNKGFVKVNTDRCLQTISESSLCTRCEEICPQPAIKTVNRKIDFDPESCSNCRLCVHVCPTEAIQTERETLKNYEAKIKSVDTVNFACEDYGSKDTDVILPCVLSLNPEMLLIASVNRKKINIVWDEKICITCHSNWTQKRCLDWIEEWNSCNVSEQKVNIIRRKKLKIGLKPTFPRKELQITTSLKKDKIKSKYKKSTEKISLTERRMYLLRNFKKISSLGQIPKQVAEKFGLTNLKIGNHCQLCFTCTSKCPTGALIKHEEGRKKALIFKPRNCIDCDICEHSCIEINKKPINFEEVYQDIKVNENSC